MRLDNLGGKVSPITLVSECLDVAYDSKSSASAGALSPFFRLRPSMLPKPLSLSSLGVLKGTLS